LDSNNTEQKKIELKNDIQKEHLQTGSRKITLLTSNSMICPNVEHILCFRSFVRSVNSNSKNNIKN
jgi:hypothetical protein